MSPQLEPMRFDSQVALVTGAGSGIGAAIAIELAGRGAHVVVNDAASDARAEAIAEEITRNGGRAVADTTRVGGFENARRLTKFAEQVFGSIDVLINNAGISRPGAFWERTDEEISDVLTVNLSGPYSLMRAVWPGMANKKYGRIVNMCSSAAFGSGISGAYAASKAGLIGLTKDAAIAAKPHGVLVNGVMPSAYTPLLDNHPDKDFREWMRMNMSAKFVAKAVCWLASSQNALSGAVFSAAGGHLSEIGFFESQGFFDPSIEVEGFQEAFGTARDFGNSTRLHDQKDHQRVTASFFTAQ